MSRRRARVLRDAKHYRRAFANGHITADECDAAEAELEDYREPPPRCYRRKRHTWARPARTINETTCPLCLEAAGVIEGRQSGHENETA